MEPTVQIIMGLGLVLAWNLKAAGQFFAGFAEYQKARRRPLHLVLAGPPYTTISRQMTKAYPVGLVGEASYQDSIRRCVVGQRVKVLHEPDNPYDQDALAVATDGDQTIGYIARDCWLQDAIHEEGRGCEATIIEISKAANGNLGVVLEVTPCGRGVGTRAYSSARVASTVEEKSWLSRLLGL